MLVVLEGEPQATATAWTEPRETALSLVSDHPPASRLSLCLVPVGRAQRALWARSRLYKLPLPGGTPDLEAEVTGAQMTKLDKSELRCVASAVEASCPHTSGASAAGRLPARLPRQSFLQY